MYKDKYFTDPLLQRALEKASLIVFDMNGLLVDDEKVQLESVNRTLLSFHISLSEQYWIEHCVGSRADKYFLSILYEKGEFLNEDAILDLIKRKNQNYRELIKDQIHKLVRPGVFDLIDFLSAGPKIELALCTSAHPMEIETILGKDGLAIEQLFTYIVSGADVEKSKPDPEIYLKLARLSKTQPTQCLVLEDSGPGVRAAVRAGMECIAVPNRFTVDQDFNGALCVLDNLTRDANRL
jgi:HAD superfamily hydrolase (TIGR01509 family)